MTNIHRGWYEINSVILTVFAYNHFFVIWSFWFCTDSHIHISHIVDGEVMQRPQSKTAANITTTPFPSSPSISSRSRPSVLRPLRYILQSFSFSAWILSCGINQKFMSFMSTKNSPSPYSWIHHYFLSVTIINGVRYYL